MSNENILTAFNIDDVINIALFFCGKTTGTGVNHFTLMDELVLEESDLYEVAYDLEIEPEFLSDIQSNEHGAKLLFTHCAYYGRLIDLINYLLNTYFTNHLHALTSSGYDPFLVKK